jgi:hypothetical protein
LVIFVAVVGLTVTFGVTSIRSSREFTEYRERTLGHERADAPWNKTEMSVDDCITFAIDWATECPGIQSWCEAEVPNVARACLESRDRREFCEEVGDRILTTGFGFHECEARREKVELEKYARRWHKKYCARAYRAVADHCRHLPPE